MANQLTNITIQDNSDVDRATKVLIEYTQYAESKYKHITSLNIPFSNKLYLVFGLIVIINILIFIFLRFIFNYSDTIQSLIFLIWIILNIGLTSYSYVVIVRNRINRQDLIDDIQISRKRLSEVIKFSSQYLENKELTDIQRFQLRLLLTEADEIYIKTEKYVKEK